MPEMDGYEVLKHMQHDGVLRDIPVVAISALDELGGAGVGPKAPIKTGKG